MPSFPNKPPPRASLRTRFTAARHQLHCHYGVNNPKPMTFIIMRLQAEGHSQPMGAVTLGFVPTHSSSHHDFRLHSSLLLHYCRLQHHFLTITTLFYLAHDFFLPTAGHSYLVLTAMTFFYNTTLFACTVLLLLNYSPTRY